jgi:hypothetical protein
MVAGFINNNSDKEYAYFSVSLVAIGCLQDFLIEFFA